jgi:hypothetical protein
MLNSPYINEFRSRGKNNDYKDVRNEKYTKYRIETKMAEMDFVKEEYEYGYEKASEDDDSLLGNKMHQKGTGYKKNKPGKKNGNFDYKYGNEFENNISSSKKKKGSNGIDDERWYHDFNGEVFYFFFIHFHLLFFFRKTSNILIKKE